MLQTMFLEPKHALRCITVLVLILDLTLKVKLSTEQECQFFSDSDN